MKLNKYISLLAAISLLIAPSCSQEDAPLKPLAEVSLENTLSTYNSLTFVWSKVPSATQYGYEMYDNYDNLVVRSVTEQTEVTVSNLKAASEYTMKVWAYAAIGSDMTCSNPSELKASTDQLKMLSAPTVEYDIVGGRYIFSWSNVPNAEGYSYTLTNSDGEIVRTGETTSRTALFTELIKGEYTFYVKATTTKGGYEKEGETASLTFTIA